MTKLLLYGLYLLGTASSHAVHQMPPSVYTVINNDSIYTVTVTVLTDRTAQELPVYRAVVSAEGGYKQQTNTLGVAPPLQVKRGDIITVTADGFPAKSIVFEPIVINYLNSEAQACPEGNIAVTIRL